jgi:arylsulfatase A-like enzyme
MCRSIKNLEGWAQMRKIIVVLAPVALALGLVFFGSYAGDTDDMGKAQAQTLTARPNIVFILTDDMLKDDMMYMPKTHSLLREQGMGFRNAFVSNAICCPSRATIMRGPYSYEEDIHVPLVVRGPGVAAGSTTYKLVLNTDYLPTFTNLAGEQIPHYVDGRSLKPVLDGSVTSWRSSILLEAAANYSQAFRGIRTVSTNTITRRKYVEYAGGAREHYNL